MKGKRLLEKILYEILGWSKVLLTALVITLVVSKTLIANAQVPTGSMETTIMAGSRILINRLSYMSEEPERGDIIAFYFPDDKSQIYLKRIIGLPGEKVEGADGEVYVNGVLLEEGYIKEKINEDFGPYIVPDSSYFVLGDNRNNSADSRFWNDKFVEAEEIIGKAMIEYFPELKRF
ncbi:MAG: signal peptidase I [Clostridium sp.]|nr:signal peptidase I [Clostridium sp.]